MIPVKPSAVSGSLGEACCIGIPGFQHVHRCPGPTRAPLAWLLRFAPYFDSRYGCDGQHRAAVCCSVYQKPAQRFGMPPAPTGPAQHNEVVFTSVPLAESAEEKAAKHAELLQLVSLLPPQQRQALEQHPNLQQLIEVVMDLGRPALARFPAGDVRISAGIVTEEELLYAVAQLGAFGGDNRAGIDRTLHRISCLRNRDGKVIGLTCRVGRAIKGSAELAADIVRAGHSILLLGRPGVGKTTAIREISRMLSDDCRKRAVIVDTSNEIGGDGDVAHPGIGSARRMQVSDPGQQHKVMIEAVENHMPEVIVIDEIGTEAEALAARTIAQRGVQLVATAHGIQLENLIKNPSLADLLGGISAVTLGDEEAKRRGVQKSILERAAPPTFDVAIEIVARDRWRIHRSVADAVDQLLAGRAVRGELRCRDEAGNVSVVEEEEEAAEAADARPSWSEAAEASTSRPAGKGGASLWSTARELEAGALHVYPYGVEEEDIAQVARELRLTARLVLTDRLQAADVILALRSKIKQGGWVRVAAKDAGVPIYAMKSGSSGNMLRALRTMLGLDPSPGAVFARQGSSGLRVGTDLLADEQNAAAEAADPGQRQEQQAGSRFQSRAVAENRAEALEEARVAVEQVVLPRRQPIELLPRAPEVIELQIDLLKQYSVTYETVGAALSERLRIFPEAVAYTEAQG